MGIKGIYKEIGPGTRISLCKLAVDTLEQRGRPLRLAIDISIWQFQIQAAKGGANPATRTLFYRLVRLLGLAIHPIFVFDGPNKPSFKRNKRVGRGDAVATSMAKRMIRLFGFFAHDAPGEAEAECAFLQQQGVVDAVLSEDVDTIMFGCSKTLRNWSSEGKGGRPPTHVSMYDAADLKQGESGLDREGMVLVALMSGGDYLPEGIPGCGVKVACEAAKAGFGKSLCLIKRSDPEALATWKETLDHELRTNGGGFFKTRHQSLAVPDSFPSLEILRYYTHPVVSPMATIERLKAEFPSRADVDITGLRAFVGETFDWSYRNGALKYIRVLAPSVLVRNLLSSTLQDAWLAGGAGQSREIEADLVQGVSSRRTHFSTDATPELRLSYTPASVVRLDLDVEPEEVVASSSRGGLALNSDDEFEMQPDGDSLTQNGARMAFDPFQPNLVWIPEYIAKMGVPVTVEEWKDAQIAKELARPAARATRSKAAKKPTQQAGTLNQYVKVTKATSTIASQKAPLSQGLQSATSSARPRALEEPRHLSQRLPARVAPKPTSSKPTSSKPTSSKPTSSKPSSSNVSRSKRSKGNGVDAAATAKPSSHGNPWTRVSSPVARRAAQDSRYDGPISISSSPSGSTSPPPSPSMSDGQLPDVEVPSDGEAFSSQTTVSARSSPHASQGSPASRRTAEATEAPRSPSKRVRGPSSRPVDARQMSIRDYSIRRKPGKDSKVGESSQSQPKAQARIVIDLCSSDEEESPVPPKKVNVSSNADTVRGTAKDTVTRDESAGRDHQTTPSSDDIFAPGSPSDMTEVHFIDPSHLAFTTIHRCLREEADEVVESYLRKGWKALWPSDCDFADLTKAN